MLTDEELQRVAGRLVEVPGVTAVMLGGSRARGAEQPDSDVDLGLYYRQPLDVQELQLLAETLAEARSGDERPTVTQPGEWGPWVDGGGWLTIGGMPVDWIYRDLDRVQASARQAQDGRFSFHFQVGHPLGVPDFAYAGEVALGVVLADPSGELTDLHDRLTTYPPALARALIGRLDEAYFLLRGSEKSAWRADVVLIAGVLFRVIGLCGHALHAKAGRWVINEKGLIEAAGRLHTAPPVFTARAHAILGGLGTDPHGLGASLMAARELLGEVAEACNLPR
nr:nucleotidyltransferase domain-containing protein [uncultured Friedmanniella sp.]